MLREFEVDLEPDGRAQSLGDSTDSDTPIHRTFFFFLPEQFQNFVGVILEICHTIVIK